MKKLFILLLTTIAFNCWSDEKIEIGLPISLTGDASTWGTDIKNTLFLANEKFFNNRYNFIVEEDQCNPKVGVAAVNKLISINKVKYIIGLTCSGVALSAAPVIEKNKVVAISASASADSISQAGDYIFRTIPEDLGGIKVLYNHIRTHYKRIAVISEETDYSQGVINALNSLNANREVEILNENFLPKNTDNKSVLTRLLSKKPDAIFLNPQSDQGLIILLRHLRELNKSIPVLGHVYPSSKTFLESVGALADGMVFANYPLFNDFNTEKSEQFKTEFIKAYGQVKSVETVVLTAYYALTALDEAIQSGQPVKEYLYSHTFEGLGGKFSFDKNGDVVGINWILKIIKNGSPQSL